MIETFIGVIAIISLSLIGYISILHNNHKAEVEGLERELEAKDRTIDKYIIKELEDELRNNDQRQLNYKAMWQELRKDVNDAINNPNPKVKPIVKASAMKVFENTLDDMDRLEDKYKEMK